MMAMTSKWLSWQPGQTQIIETSAKKEPTKPTKLSFDGFDGSVSKENPIIRVPEPARSDPKVECPYTLPEGVKLVRFAKKTPPVAVTVCSVVTDVPKFIRHALAELDARLHRPVQIKAGDSVFELLSKLADCGVELRLEWPPETQIISHFPEAGPTKPSKLPLEVERH